MLWYHVASHASAIPPMHLHGLEEFSSHSPARLGKRRHYMQQFLKAPLFLGWRKQGLIGGSEAGFQPPLSQALLCPNTPSFPPEQRSRTAMGELQLWATLGLQWLIKLTTWLVIPPSITGKTSWSKWKHSPCLPATHPPSAHWKASWFEGLLPMTLIQSFPSEDLQCPHPRCRFDWTVS